MAVQCFSEEKAASARLLHTLFVPVHQALGLERVVQQRRIFSYVVEELKEVYELPRKFPVTEISAISTVHTYGIGLYEGEFPFQIN